MLVSMKTGSGPSLVVDIADVNSLILLALPHMKAAALDFPDADRKTLEKGSDIIGTD